MIERSEQQIEILEAAIVAYKNRKMKFTMDDIAGILHMSKKTIYTVYSDKEALFLAMVDYLFDGIKEVEAKVLAEPDLDVVSRLKKLLSAMPETFTSLDFSDMYVLKDKYPASYDKVVQRLDEGWETTYELIAQGVEEGKLKKIDLNIFKLMLEGTLQQFFQKDILKNMNKTYPEVLNEVVDIMINGIRR